MQPHAAVAGPAIDMIVDALLAKFAVVVAYFMISLACQCRSFLQ